MRLVAVLALLCLVRITAPAELPNPVQLIRISSLREFPEATEPGAIQYACAASRDDLARFFADQQLPFQTNLIRKQPGNVACHIYYEPTIRGFRASPDNARITGLIAAIDPRDFGPETRPLGDSLDIVKAVLRELPELIDVSIIVNEEYESTEWPTVLEKQFGSTPHRMSTLSRPNQVSHAWVQDLLKSGSADGRLRILVPRRLFEGREADGETFRPLLDAMQEEAYVRSKISWEGGDLQFVADPKNPRRVLMFYGSTARNYWGADLPSGDLEYVLRAEFGADQAVDLSSLGLHTDMLVSFLPSEGIALVARQERQNPWIARAAVDQLIEIYGENAPQQLRALRQAVKNSFSDLNGTSQRVWRLTELLRAELPRIPLRGEGGADGIETSGLPLEATDTILRANLTNRMLRLIEGQLPDAPFWMEGQLDALVDRMRKLGFRVVRTPHAVSKDIIEEWLGVSYINLLAVDHTLFVPTFGLGEADERALAALRRQLPETYQLVPVNARYNLMYNGGVHCTFGIVREVWPPKQSPEGAMVGALGQPSTSIESIR